MLGVVVQIDGYDPVAAAPVTLRAASRDDVALCHLNGLTWWPAIAKLPTLRYDLFDGAFGGQITAPSSTLTLVAEAWPDFGRYTLADARLRLWTGELGADWAGYTLRFDGRISDQPQLKDGQAAISFAVDDRWLDKALLTTYAGTTGAEGVAALSFLVEGDSGGTDGWARKPGQLIRRLAILSGGAGKIDNASLDRLDAARPYPLSLDLEQQTTAREMIQKLAASVNAVAGVTWTGSLFVAPIELATPTVTLAADGSSLPPVSSVEQIAISPPWGKLAIGAERAWTVHALSDIAFTATLVDLGAYAAGTTYREGNIVAYQGSTWLYINTTASSGNAPPMLPVEENGYWRVLARAGRDGNPGEVGSGSWTHIANSPTTIVTPNSARSTVSGPWGTDASQSQEGYTRGAAVDFILPAATGSNRHAMAGLTAHPQSGLSFDRISFAIYRAPDGYMDIRIDGTTYTSVNLPDPAKPVACRVEFDGVDTVRWYIAGTLRTTFFWNYPDSPLYFATAFSGTDGQVNSIAFSAIGARGRNGSDGLPGATGADGKTERTHYAYANAPNGSVDFTVGAPDGRAYVGVYVDFTAADSTNPAAYVWSPYKGPASFGLAARGDVALASNSLIKTGYAAWGGGGGFSTEGWQNGAQTSFKLATVDTIAGLNTDPTSNDSFETIDYAFHCSGDGNTYVYESGQPVLGLVGGNDGTRTFQIVYDNATVMYLVNGKVVRQRPAASNLTLYFDAAIAGVPGQRITDISFVAAGTVGADGNNGANGANGADGFSVSLSTYVMKVQLTAAGAAKSGELPQYVNVRVLRGAVDVTASCAFGLTASASLGASISGNNVELTGASADGTIDITASYAGITLQPQRVKVATIRDNAAPSSVGVSSGPNDATISSTSYTDGYSAKSVVLQPNANGVVRYYGGGSYYAAAKANINTSVTLAGKSQYRAVGTGAWLDGGAEVAGSRAAYRPADGPDPGGISISNDIGGLTPLTNYEFRMIYRITQISNMEATGIQGGTMTAEQP